MTLAMPAGWPWARERMRLRCVPWYTIRRIPGNSWPCTNPLPSAQTALFDFAGELIARERLGQGETFDFLCLVDGSAALLGYETGARSPLMQQMVLQLDRRLETLLTQLRTAPGENAYDLVLAGAHGAPPEPPAESRPRMAVNGEKLARALEWPLSAAGPGIHVEKYLYPFLYLNPGSASDRRGGAPAGGAFRSRAARRGWIFHRPRRLFDPGRLGTPLPQ